MLNQKVNTNALAHCSRVSMDQPKRFLYPWPLFLNVSCNDDRDPSKRSISILLKQLSMTSRVCPIKLFYGASLLGSAPTIELTDSDKHSSLFWYGYNCGR
jgi:hypothetical protein